MSEQINLVKQTIKRFLKKFSPKKQKLFFKAEYRTRLLTLPINMGIIKNCYFDAIEEVKQQNPL